MASGNYKTSSKKFGELNGHMVMNDGVVTSYRSDLQGDGITPPNQQRGNVLVFSVEFPRVNQAYTIDAVGDSGDKLFIGTVTPIVPGGNPEAEADDWTATDHGPEPPA